MVKVQQVEYPHGFQVFLQDGCPFGQGKTFPSSQCFLLLHPCKVLLVHETSHIDPRIIHVVKNLGSGSPVAIILAETLKVWMLFIGRKQHSLRGVLFFFKYDP